jgi:hypothetical protein
MMETETEMGENKAENGRNEIIIFRSKDGKADVGLRVFDGSAWLTQLEIADLFATSKQNVSLHIGNILEEGELSENSVVKESLTTAADGKSYQTKIYSLPLILAVGYRVRSPRGTEFRQWATRNLSEYLVKGFILNDERLKNPGGWDHFDELLERIREIRASEKRFYQKVRDLFALSEDYKDDEKAAQMFFAEVQNKMLFAVTRKTAAELIVSRADASVPNMNLTSWKGSRVRWQDVIVAKNYLTKDEIDLLNRLVVIFLDQAAIRVKEHNLLTLDYWRGNVDKMLSFSEKPVLSGPGSVSHEDMKKIVRGRYDEFDLNRNSADARLADAEDIKAIEDLENQLKKEKDEES